MQRGQHALPPAMRHAPLYGHGAQPAEVIEEQHHQHKNALSRLWNQRVEQVEAESSKRLEPLVRQRDQLREQVSDAQFHNSMCLVRFLSALREHLCRSSPDGYLDTDAAHHAVSELVRRHAAHVSSAPPAAASAAPQPPQRQPGIKRSYDEAIGAAGGAGPGCAADAVQDGGETSSSKRRSRFSVAAQC